jgi:hypothetical protein
MLSAMLFKVAGSSCRLLSKSRDLSTSADLGVSLQVTNCIASGIVPKNFFAGGILVFN